MSLMSGIYNIGIGAGALIGNQVSAHVGMSAVGYVGAAFGAVSLLWCLYSLRKYPQLRSNF
ncbi:Sugar efflux transporter [Tatumella ptyseos]|uniref:Sugar efflux transporter n=3 Tax=Erwiniaceae TaxID=1903409 RepID=A0A2X5NNG0_9GAMM|nr:Sugar efflux transporter [Tatumella ptyseos]